MKRASYDIVIVGAGIVGAACAAECSSEGLRVAVIEAQVVGGGATAAGMGHIVVMDDSEAQFALTRYSRDLWHELAESLPSDTGFRRFGTIWVAADDEEMLEVQRKQQFYRDRGVTVSVLEAKELATLEPNLRPDLAGGLLMPDDAVIYPPAAARFLLDRAQQSGTLLYVAAGGGADGPRRQTERWVFHGSSHDGQRHWNLVAAVDPGHRSSKAERASGDYRSLSRLCEPPAC